MFDTRDMFCILFDKMNIIIELKQIALQDTNPKNTIRIIWRRFRALSIREYIKILKLLSRDTDKIEENKLWEKGTSLLTVIKITRFLDRLFYVAFNEEDKSFAQEHNLEVNDRYCMLVFRGFADLYKCLEEVNLPQKLLIDELDIRTYTEELLKFSPYWMSINNSKVYVFVSTKYLWHREYERAAKLVPVRDPRK